MANFLSILAEDLGGEDRIAKLTPRVWLVAICQQAGEDGLSLTLAEIARQTGKSKSSAGRIVESLVQAGLLVRRRAAALSVLALPSLEDPLGCSTGRSTGRPAGRVRDADFLPKVNIAKGLPLASCSDAGRAQDGYWDDAWEEGEPNTRLDRATGRLTGRAWDALAEDKSLQKIDLASSSQDNTGRRWDDSRDDRREAHLPLGRSWDDPEVPKLLKNSRLGNSPERLSGRSRDASYPPPPPPPPPLKKINKLKEEGGGRAGSDEIAAAVDSIWKIFCAKRKECLEALGAHTGKETLTARRRQRIIGLLIEKGPEALLKAISNLHRSDWHLGLGRFEGSPHRLFTESVFSTNGKADQIEILQGLHEGPPLWESRPMSLEQRRLQAPLLAHQQMELPEIDFEGNRADLIERIPVEFEELRCQVAELDLTDLEEAENRLQALQESIVEAHWAEAEDEIQELRQSPFWQRSSAQGQRSAEHQVVRRKIGLPVLSVCI